MTLAAPLRSTLLAVADVMAPARHDWWIVASAALALHGVEVGDVRDVDVLIDPRDAAAVLDPLGLKPAVGRSDGRFRSDLFVTWTSAALPIELFAGFDVFDGATWRGVIPSSREPISVGDSIIWVPSRADLHAMLLRFGRDKDIARAALLNPSDPFPSRSGSA